MSRPGYGLWHRASHGRVIARESNHERTGGSKRGGGSGDNEGVIFAHGGVPPDPSFPDFLARWNLDPLALIPVGVVAGLYLRGVAIVGRRHPATRIATKRTACFLAGLAVVVVALCSPVEVYDTALLSVHMVQHLLLTVVAAPLLLLGGPFTVAVRATGPRSRAAIQTLLGSRGIHSLTHPLITWTVFATVMWGTHFTGFYDAALESEWAHRGEHALFIGAALLFWLPLFGVDPARRRMAFPVRCIYLFMAMPQNTFLALSIFGAKTVLYDHYATLTDPWLPNALSDQKLAGGIMWVVGDVMVLIALVALMMMWARHEDRMTVLLDARLDAEERTQATTRLSTAMETNSSPR